MQRYQPLRFRHSTPSYVPWAKEPTENFLSDKAEVKTNVNNLAQKPIVRKARDVEVVRAADLNNTACI